MPGGRRGPLSQALRAAVRVRCAIGHDRRLSFDEAEDAATGLTRRDFLRRSASLTGGVVVGAKALDRFRAPAPMRRHGPQEPRVVIVGAGLAGMAAAYWLTEAGVPVRVHEAQSRIGGRCWSAHEFEGGQVGEHGGEFIDTRHVHTRRLVRELGLDLDDLYEEGAAGRSPTFVDGEIVGRNALFEGMDEAIARLTRVAETNGPFVAGEASPGAIAFDEQTMADWFDDEVPGGIDSALGRVFAAEQASWWGADPHALSATNLIDYFVVDSPGADERYTVHGGNDQIVHRIMDRLPDGTVELESPLEAIRTGTGGTAELVFAGSPEPIVADQVILAVPFTTLRDVDVDGAGFSAAKLAAIRELGMGTNAKVLVQLSQPFPVDGWSGTLVRGDEPSYTTWESGATDGPGAADFGLLTVYSGGRLGAGYDPPEAHAPASPEVTSSAFAAVDAVVPGISASFDGRAWLDAWSEDPWVHGSYAAFLPGQYTRFYGLMGREEGRVHFAGEHTSLSSQGYLDGGVETGDRAAVEVLGALGVPVPDALEATRRAARRFRPRYPWS